MHAIRLPGYQVRVTRLRLPDYGYQITVTRLRLPGYGYQITVTRLRLPGYGFPPEMTTGPATLYKCIRIQSCFHKILGMFQSEFLFYRMFRLPSRLHLMRLDGFYYSDNEVSVNIYFYYSHILSAKLSLANLQNQENFFTNLRQNLYYRRFMFRRAWPIFPKYFTRTLNPSDT